MSSMAFENQVIVDRSNLAEDISREPLILAKVPELAFQELSEEEFAYIDSELLEIINGVPFNNIRFLEDLIQYYEAQVISGRTLSLLDAFSELELDSSFAARITGTNCVGMDNLLRERLQSEGITSFNSPSSTVIGYVNQAAWSYIDTTHAVVSIPIRANTTKGFVIVDPGFGFTASFRVIEGQNTEFVHTSLGAHIIRLGSRFHRTHPYSLRLERNGAEVTEMEIAFDPNHSLLNPDQTITKDVMRGMDAFVYKLKDDRSGRRVSYGIDYLNRQIKFKLSEAVAGQFDLPAFAEMISFEQFYALSSLSFDRVAATFMTMGLSIETGFTRLQKIISYRDQFLEEILPPSVRKKLDPNKTM